MYWLCTMVVSWQYDPNMETQLGRMRSSQGEQLSVQSMGAARIGFLWNTGLRSQTQRRSLGHECILTKQRRKNRG